MISSKSSSSITTVKTKEEMYHTLTTEWKHELWCVQVILGSWLRFFNPTSTKYEQQRCVGCVFALCFYSAYEGAVNLIVTYCFTIVQYYDISYFEWFELFFIVLYVNGKNELI